MPRVYGPDGNWIDFPEGTDQQTIKGVMARYYGAPGKPATEKFPLSKEASLEPVAKGEYVSKTNGKSLPIEVHLADGTILQLPAGTADAVVGRVVKQHIASTSQLQPTAQAGAEQLRTITVTYQDGSQHVYQNAPANLTTQQVIERSKRDGDRQIVSIEDRPQASRATAADSGPSAAKNTGNRFEQIVANEARQGEWPHWVTGNVIAASALALAAFLFLIARAASRTQAGGNFVNALSNSRAIRLAASNAPNLRWIGLIGAGAFMLTGAFVWPEGVEIELSSRRIADGPLLRSVIYTFPSAPFAIAIGTMLAAAAWLFRPAKAA